MKNQNLNLKIGDKIGFTFLAQTSDDTDKTVFFPVVELTKRDGETAYICEFPDGSRTSAIVQSVLLYRGVQITPAGVPDMLCISDRRAEFVEALERGKTSNLEVFPDWDRDAFVVVNHDKGNEYRVNLETAGNQIFAECECKDYEFRRRSCKHIGAVLVDSMLTVKG